MIDRHYDRATAFSRAKDRFILAARVYMAAREGHGACDALTAAAFERLKDARRALDQAGREKVAEMEALERSPP